jgi:transposase, IS6 family
MELQVVFTVVARHLPLPSVCIGTGAIKLSRFTTQVSADKIVTNYSTAGEHNLANNLFKWKHFESDIILLCIRWYLKYPLSYRNLVEMMAERGLSISHTTILRWVVQYAPILDERIRKHLNSTNDSWRMDETYIRIKGVYHYLYRAVDSKGQTIDFWLSEHRDKQSARHFLQKALRSEHNQMPRVITTDRYPATEVAIAEEIYFGDLAVTVQHRMVQYLNNIIEQDHRLIKRITKPMLGFKNFRSACATISGIEIMHMLRKRQAGNMSSHEEAAFICCAMNAC